jgi:hypothetical protein
MTEQKVVEVETFTKIIGWLIFEGAGIKFGKNVSRAFLQENSLKMLIRSHEMVDEGYQVN